MNFIKALLFIATGLVSAFALLAISSKLIGRPHDFYSFIATIVVWWLLLFRLALTSFFKPESKTPK